VHPSFFERRQPGAGEDGAGLGTFRANEAKASEERIMDSMDLEREKGITSRARNAAFKYKNCQVNIMAAGANAIRPAVTSYAEATSLYSVSSSAFCSENAGRRRMNAVTRGQLLNQFWRRFIMKKIVVLGAALIAFADVCFCQVGGGAGGMMAGRGASVYRTTDYGGVPDSRQRERSKRQASSAEMKDDGTSVFIDAAVLMNVKPDEYVAVFGIVEEAKTIAEANTKMDATISHFKDAIKALGVKEADLLVDFVIQNRIYEYVDQESFTKEELVGYELKKNVSIHYLDKHLLDQLVRAAASNAIYDLIKVDCVVNDLASIQAQLREEAARIVKSKADRYKNLLGVKLSNPVQVLADNPSIYYPDEQYNAYTAAEAQRIEYNGNRRVLNARKSRTFYFNPLTADGFDTVINPVIIEPVAQFTTFLKVKYETGRNVRR
jgi:uncharacterized protein YggE